MTGNRREALRSVAVVGGGPVALTTAVALAQALPAATVTVVPVPVPPDALADRLPLALPAVHDVLATIGLTPDRLLARGVARPRLATRFRDWSVDGATWMIGDDAAATLPQGKLHALWLRAQATGGRVPPFHALVPGCVAAAAGIADRRVEPALHLDPVRLGSALATVAGQAGVVLSAPLAEVDRSADGVSGVTLQDGTRIFADLFVDASGPERLLAKGAVEDWSDALPCDRLILSPAPDDPGSCDDYRATDTGWTARWPGVVAQGQHGGDGIALSPGRLAAPFAGNVLAIGDAATQPGPLGLTGFTLALTQLALLLELMPARGDEPLLRAEYNRRAGERADRLRDFLGCHYYGGGRMQGPFWQRLRTLDRPASLDRLLVQFARRGHLVGADEETVPRDAWLALLLGQGIRPERPDPVAMSVPVADAARWITTLAARLASDHPQ